MGPAAPISIREMKNSDIARVVEIHNRSFPGFFLTFLGDHFLGQLYQSIVEDVHGIAFVGMSGESIEGFVAGTSQTPGFYRRLIRTRWQKFALASAEPALRNPRIIPRLIRALKKPSEASPNPNEGTLMSIAVHPDYQGRGLGKVLVHAFLEESTQRGIKKVFLTTDKHNNDSVNSFYIMMGFKPHQTLITPEGRHMVEYVINLPLPNENLIIHEYTNRGIIHIEAGLE